MLVTMYDLRTRLMDTKGTDFKGFRSHHVEFQTAGVISCSLPSKFLSVTADW